ncbi:MAG: hypothetical protein IPH44_20550 [Myxococcales bacterium]|nr:hypothetical protein [Myxococcales bacterium]MBK7195208.1 hypothetical protein [Myxococcales bacterium]
MDERELEKRLVRLRGGEAVREFLQTYVHDSDRTQLEATVRHMVVVNPFTIDTGIDGLAEVLAMQLAPGTLARLVSHDANRDLDDPSDDGARVWLAALLRDLQAWCGSS